LGIGDRMYGLILIKASCEGQFDVFQSSVTIVNDLSVFTNGFCY